MESRVRNALATAVVGLLLLAPRVSEACYVCSSGRDDETRTAFLVTTAFLSVLPLTLVGGLVWFLVRRTRQLEREAAERAAGDDEMFSCGANDVAFRSQPVEIDVQVEFPQVRVVAQNDLMRGDRFAVATNRKFGAGHLFQESLKFLRPIAGGWRSVIRNHNGEFRFGLSGERE